MKSFVSFLFLFHIAIILLGSQIEVNRISQRIIILNEGYFRSIAVLTNKGVVLIDTRRPIEKMEEIKQIIKTEFSTDHFCYIINTHGCPEHILGNPSFPGVPVIMNENFFNRQKLYLKQKQYIDSLELKCNQANDSSEKNDICDKYEKGENWQKICIEALKIKPDLTFSKRMSLYFEGLTIQITFVGLIHGYSTFIYIPEERFLHTSTLNSKMLPPKFFMPEYLDKTEFLPYQIQVLKEFKDLGDSLKYIIPCHNEPYSSGMFNELITYYLDMYDYAHNTQALKIDFDKFKEGCTIEKMFPNSTLFKNLDENDIKRHNDNIEWLWKYYH